MKKKVIQLTLAQALAGFTLNIEARHLSPHTLTDYKNTFKKFQAFVGNPEIHSIKPEQINEFLAAQTTVGNKTLLNYHIGLSSFWHWLEKQEIVEKNIIRLVDRPKPEKRMKVPLEEHEVKALLAAIEKSAPYHTRLHRPVSHALPNDLRNRAMILFMLDNGIRVSELSALRVKDLDEKKLRAFVLGKGSKERYVPYCARTGQVLWKYLATRGDLDREDYVFATGLGRRMTTRLIQQTLGDIGTRAGVADVHPHRFRHTFAITYLRAGGDIFTLQMILGHSNLEMTKLYSAIANQDIKRAHRLASPVEYMHL